MTLVGVFGGSFDPIHRGHVAIADHALRALELERVLLLPCAEPPHKLERALATRYHRLEMLCLAAEDRPGLHVSTLEIAQQGVCYTIDTMRALRSADPSRAFVFICGADAIADVATWRGHDALLDEFDIIAFARPLDSEKKRDAAWPDLVSRRITPLSPELPAPLGAGGRVFLIDNPPSSVSSSLVRSRLAAGRPAGDLVPARVARYIQRHRLYSEEASR